MFFNAYRLILCFLTLSIALGGPIPERAELDSRAPMPAPAPPPKKARPKPVVLGPGNNFVSNARKANNAPGRVIPKACKKLSDCSCPMKPNSKTGHSTSCINGFCSCDNAAVNTFTNVFLEGVKAIGNAAITKAIGHLMQGLADVKQVVGVIVGAFLGPAAKAGLKVALMAFPDVGPSHIDKATKGILTKVL